MQTVGVYIFCWPSFIISIDGGMIYAERESKRVTESGMKENLNTHEIKIDIETIAKRANKVKRAR